MNNIKEKLKRQKIINDFKRYIEVFYIDIVNNEMIEEYCNEFNKSEEVKEILKRRFNLI